MQTREKKINKNKLFIMVLIITGISLAILFIFIQNKFASKAVVAKYSNMEDYANNANTENNVIDKEIIQEMNVEIGFNDITKPEENEIDIPQEVEDNNINTDEKLENIVQNGNKKNRKFNEKVAFIGDSRTQGLLMYTGLNDVIDYSYIGLMVDTAISKELVKGKNGEKITILEDMQKRDLDTVYIMLGVNELGWSYSEVFVSKYKELIQKIKSVQPDCEIILQSIIPITKSRSDSDNIFNNKNINKYNKLIQQIAIDENVTFLNVGAALADKNGNLPEEASSDGIHVDVDYCEKWLDYLKNN